MIDNGLFYILNKKLSLNLSLPLFIVSLLVLLIVFVAVFRTLDLQPYSISKQLNVKAEKEIALKIGMLLSMT